uniref:Ependymin n=1 Tax=Cyprinus carpio TaxID=7962 RepID=A0A8C2E1D8_CYPCA
IQIFDLVFLCIVICANSVQLSHLHLQQKVISKHLLFIPSLDVSTGGHDLASGEFSYDSKANKFRFVEDTAHANKTSYMDVLIHFEEVGLISNSDSLYSSFSLSAPPSQGREPEFLWGMERCLKFMVSHYSMSTTSCGCLPVSGSYYGEKKDLLFSFFGVETEVDDLQVFVPPAFCEGVAFEEAPDDHSFFDLFHD